MPTVDRTPIDVATDIEHLKGSKNDEGDDDDEEMEERIDEHGDEAESSLSDEVSPKAHSKVCQDCGVHAGGAKTPGVTKPTVSAMLTRGSKRGQSEPDVSPEKAAKQPNSMASKPHKTALLRINVDMPMALV